MLKYLAKRWLSKHNIDQSALEQLVLDATSEAGKVDDMLERLEKQFTEQIAAAEKAHAERAAKPRPKKPADIERERLAKLDGMLSALRPGMHIAELAGITEASEGKYTPESLRKQGEWIGGAGTQYAIDFSEDGIITRVSFHGATEDTKPLLRAKKIKKALESVPGVSEALDLETVEGPIFQALEVGRDSDHYAVIAWYDRQAFKGTMYLTHEERDKAASAIEKRTKPRPQGAIPFRQGDLDPMFEAGEAGAKVTAKEADAALRAHARETATDPHDRIYLDIVEWLIAESTPDDRHELMNYNWGHGLALKYWIVRQPDTDVATVLMAFDLCQASSYIPTIARGDTPRQSAFPFCNFDFAVEVGRRLARNDYRPPAGHSAIGYIPRKPTWDKSDPAIQRAEELLIPSSVFNPIKGRRSDSVYSESIPHEWYEYLN